VSSVNHTSSSFFSSYFLLLQSEANTNSEERFISLVRQIDFFKDKREDGDEALAGEKKEEWAWETLHVALG